MATQLRIIKPANNDVLAPEGGIFMVRTLYSAITLYLPHPCDIGVAFKIYDEDFQASVHNITIKTLYPTDLINSAATLVMDINGQGVEVFKRIEGEFFNAVSAAGGGGGGGGGIYMRILHGNGSPEGVVIAFIGEIYQDDLNGDQYRKLTDNGLNTGWMGPY